MEESHHRVVAVHDVFEIAVHASTTDRRLTFTGETPPLSDPVAE